MLKENGLELVLESEVEDTEALVKEQVPSARMTVEVVQSEVNVVIGVIGVIVGDVEKRLCTARLC